MFSRAGKEVLLKSVIYAIPGYVMSVFLLPLSLCSDIERFMSKFWWSTAHDKGMVWQKWDRLCAAKSLGGLNFRKINYYNLALLAKQGWRLMTKPDSLFARVFRSRYFANGDFLNASLGSNPSYGWQIILATQSVIRANCGIRIGDGSSTRIWGSPWLTEDNPFIESAPPCDAIECTVDGLMQPDSFTWDPGLLNGLFNTRDVNAIQKVPTPVTRQNDVWRWNLDPSGMLTVKSTYRYIYSAGIGSTHTVRITDWDRIWKLDVPCNVKNFLWRCISGCLPVRTALRRRNIDVPDHCPMCDQPEETILHVLVVCPVASSTWARSDVFLPTFTAQLFAEWWNVLVDQRSNKSIEYAVMILWGLWKNRNSRVWRGISDSTTTIIRGAKTSLATWNAAHSPTNGPSICAVNRQQKWSPPPSQWLKINVDASCPPGSDRIGLGSVVRNASGLFVAASRSSISGLFDVKVAEAMGIREALSWIKQRGWCQVIVETDSQVCMTAIYNASTDHSLFGLIIQDCRNLLAAVSNVIVEFVYRSANSVAHLLARDPDSVAGRMEWERVPPSFIDDVLRSDV